MPNIESKRDQMTRSEYRRLIKQDEKAIKNGVDVQSRDGEMMASLARVLRDKLRKCVQSGSVSSLMHFLHQTIDVEALSLADIPIACRKGCSHCCNIWVDAMPPEVFYTVRTMDPKAKARARLAVEQAMIVTAEKTFDERGEMVTPCPLLIDDQCSVYASRPLNCRTAVSADAEICKGSYLDVNGEDIPTPMMWIMLRQGYGTALAAATTHAGLASTSVEWNHALQIALNQPDAEARWLKGEDVFAEVQSAVHGHGAFEAETKMFVDYAFANCP